MTSEVVKYHNDLNTVAMRKWTAEEMNFFFSIIAKARNQGTKELIFDKYELAELAQYTIDHNKRFYDTMERLANHITQLRYIERTKNSIAYMTLFEYFEVDWSDDLSEMTATVSISSRFEYIVNKLNANFTAYELSEFTNIRSTYAKTAYRLLKQWRTVGRKEFSTEEFKVLMDMPKTYQASHIDRLVIKPILKELSQYFINLKCKKVKSNKRGNPVLGYEFTWKPETTNGTWDDKKFVAPQTEGKKAKSNTPSWSNPDYKNETTSEEKAKLDKLKQEMLSRIDNAEPVVVDGQTSIDEFLED